MAQALDIFRALADPTRLRILSLVARMELSVGELAQVLEQSQPRVSRHVKILTDAGLAVRRKEGSWVFVALGAAVTTAPVLAAMDAWAGPLDHALADADGQRLAAVLAERTAAAAQWFQAHAGEWDAIRNLYIAESEIEQAMLNALGTETLGRLVDIGTGTGRMLELFGPMAASAIGIDRSSEMLRLARAKLTERGLDRAELRQADFYALPVEDAEADAAILHHVLHFAHAPEQVLAEAGRVLATGGRLLVVDFAPHSREELRTQEAHARLGFSDEQMLGWFAAAGLVPERVDTLEGGELTVKLWVGRKRAAPVTEKIAA
ncbi:metalloregulator ArsR/SmtB family transcription factor [Sphingomonas sp. BGYR3]|uniref:ArsR/SmtB family transcription factor n=1 Tax=Sphingomonas sp. BGYR3 TaxID=2975483 RepID=UPI0021A83FA1|nr:metalloregulator ArsR/SmtB family transcription factor [Sphingomonas sp. BGYR3]MDG5489498.1 metalloregulator ArsR/SmtB family transcription factor [Sphingomonas sp. BGYR3]